MTNIEQLERHLAYHCARSDIEMLCTANRLPDGGIEFNINTPQTDEWEAESLANAVRYLEHRNLLKRRIDNPDYVTILDETEQQ